MEEIVDHGNPEEWAELSTEETRCLLGLKRYYMGEEQREEQDSLEKAWSDVKREHPRLESFIWFR